MKIIIASRCGLLFWGVVYSLGDFLLLFWDPLENERCLSKNQPCTLIMMVQHRTSLKSWTVIHSGLFSKKWHFGVMSVQFCWRQFTWTCHFHIQTHLYWDSPHPDSLGCWIVPNSLCLSEHEWLGHGQHDMHVHA